MKQTHRKFARGMVLAALVCLPPGLSRPAGADGQAQDKAAIQAAYQKVDAAMGREDTDGCVAFLRPDFVDTDRTGKAPKVKARSKEAERKKLAQDFVGVTAVTQHTTLTRVHFGLGRATAWTPARIFL